MCASGDADGLFDVHLNKTCTLLQPASPECASMDTRREPQQYDDEHDMRLVFLAVCVVATLFLMGVLSWVSFRSSDALELPAVMTRSSASLSNSQISSV